MAQAFLTMAQAAVDNEQLKQHAANKFNTLERFMWPGGSEAKPPVNQNHVRMYGHNLCPFVCRSRWTFAAKEVAYQEVLVDLTNKAQWHLDFNNGFLPVLEVPSGELIPESQIIADYSLQVAQPNQGEKLIPDDPVLTAQMRFKMQKFDKEILGFGFALFMSRFQDEEKINAYIEGAVPLVEAMCEVAGSDKWLMGTTEMTQLDVHCGAQWDFIYTMAQATAFNPEGQRVLDAAPKWCAYMERIRAHPKIAPVAMKLEVANRYSIRARAHEQGVKCQLGLADMVGLFADCP